jgi:hypothetical protein
VYLLPAYPAVAILAARALAPVLSLKTRHALIVASIAMLVATNLGRIRAAESDQLLEFARRVEPRVAGAATVGAGAGVAENDRLILSWRLGRSIARERPVCAPGVLVIVRSEATERMAPLGFRVLDVADERGIALVECAFLVR